ncbi:hypothetical protein D3C87_1647970 [compost metagenome]
MAPAKNARACICSFMASRPADRRTWDCGIRMRATASMRMKSNGSTSSAFSSGVPATFTSMLIGTDSGCSGRLASWISRLARSSSDSPMPRMPPEQIFIPDSRT